MNKIYVLLKEGVYRHNIMGLFLTEKQAWERALDILKNNEVDDDGYHIVTVGYGKIGVPLEDIEVLGFMRRFEIGRVRLFKAKEVFRYDVVYIDNKFVYEEVRSKENIN